MTLERFNRLSEKQKLSAFHKAVLLAKRTDGVYAVTLFQLAGFYIEVFCCLQAPSLEFYRTFASTDRLKPYLDQIIVQL